ncbi:MAG: hypothetical protein ACK6DM_09700 [Alphaproteobacteria bacterium]
MMAKRPDRGTAPQRTVLLVLGMHRSGTSLLTRISSFLGAALPRQLVPASEGNPTGHWEPARLVELHEQLLASIGSSWDDWRAANLRWRDTDPPATIATRIVQAFDEEYPPAPMLVLKDPRICRTLPLWLSVLEKANCKVAPVIIVRNPLEVAESLRERDGMSFEKAMLLWLRHYLDAEHATRNMQRNIMSLDMLLLDFRNIVAQTAGRLGIQWPRSIHDATSDIADFIDRDLHNHRATLAQLESHTEVPSSVKLAYRALNTLCDEPRANDPKRELDRIRQMFNESAKMFGVVAFAQTEALKQAEADVAEARARADAADALRRDLAHERAALSELASQHQTLIREANETLTSLAATTERANTAEQRAQAREGELARLKQEMADLGSAATATRKRAETAERRAEAAEKNAATLVHDIAELDRNRNEMAQTLARMTADASSLKAMAESVSRRTEWIEGEIRKQTTGSKPSRADIDAANARIMSLSDELQAALANAMTLSRELAATKEELHHPEKKAIKLSAEAQRHAEALATAQDQMRRLQDEADTARGEIAELRAELAEAWTMGGKLAPDQQAGTISQLPATIPPDGSDIAARAKRIEEDLRFERMHVQQLEQRLNSWRGLAGAMLRKITRLGAAKPRRTKAPTRQRLKQAPATSR